MLYVPLEARLTQKYGGLVSVEISEYQAAYLSRNAKEP